MKISTLLAAVSLLCFTTLIGCGPTDALSPVEAIEAPTHVQQGETDYHCDAGPSAGMSCQVSADCAAYCYTGPSAGAGCTVNPDGSNTCTKMCSNGPSKYSACVTSADCSKYCVGNASTVGQACTTNSNCGPGGVCQTASCGGVGCGKPACG
jgi:hypothetical protein